MAKTCSKCNGTGFIKTTNLKRSSISRSYCSCPVGKSKRRQMFGNNNKRATSSVGKGGKGPKRKK